MNIPRSAIVALLLASSATVCDAGNPPNPYAGFNLSGINYGSMQWERDQRAGKVVWPYFNTPVPSARRARGSAAGSTARGAQARPGRILRGRR